MIRSLSPKCLNSNFISLRITKSLQPHYFIKQNSLIHQSPSRYLTYRTHTSMCNDKFYNFINLFILTQSNYMFILQIWILLNLHWLRHLQVHQLWIIGTVKKRFIVKVSDFFTSNYVLRLKIIGIEITYQRKKLL